MKVQEAALAFKGWAQENHLMGAEFPVSLSADKDELFDSLKITSASESVFRTKQIKAVGFNEAESKVFVLTGKKLTLKEKKTLPQTFGDDVSVVYVQGGSATAAPPEKGYSQSGYVVSASGGYACGSSIFPARQLGAGTLGCLVKDQAGELFGLSNNHVSGMCNYARIGEKILAPGHPDIEAKGLDPFTIGYHHSAMQMVSGVPDNVDVIQNNDAALLKIADVNRVSSMQGGAYDTPSISQPLQPGLQVEKVGRTTGHTSGKVLCQVAGPFQCEYPILPGGIQVTFFDPVFIVQGDSGAFSLSGDSGSLVVANMNGERYAVGLVFAGDQQGLSYILPIEPILANLKVSLVKGHNV